MTRRDVVGLLIGVLLASHVVAAAFLARQGDAPPVSDWKRGFYADVDRHSEIVTSPGRPYRDFDVEYPPLVVAELKGVVGASEADTVHRLAWSQLACELVLVAALGWGFGSAVTLAYLVLMIPFTLYPFVFTRIDMLSVMLAVLGMAAIKRRFPSHGAGFLALSLFAKAWPVVVAPVLLLRREQKAARVWLTVAAVGGVAWLAWGGIGGPVQVFTFRDAKGWQIESTVGAIWHAVARGAPQMSSGSWRVGDVPFLASVLLGLLAVALVARTWVLAARHAEDEQVQFGIAPLAAVAALMVCSPLLSPQFVLWLLPWAAIASASGNRLRSRGWVLGAMTFAATALTAALYYDYNAVFFGHLRGDMLVLTRNALLIGLIPVSWSALASRGRSIPAAGAAPGTSALVHSS